jgi:hypothetical protein
MLYNGFIESSLVRKGLLKLAEIASPFTGQVCDLGPRPFSFEPCPGRVSESLLEKVGPGRAGEKLPVAGCGIWTSDLHA